MSEELSWPEFVAEPLCIADFRVEGPIMSMGQSPFGERRVGYITGGEFSGADLSGEILPGGGNWSLSGRLNESTACGTFDARSVWRTRDGALVYVTYSGRSVVPDEVGRAFRDPDAAPVDRMRYYIRIAPVFETSVAQYAWLNGVLAVAYGQRMAWGIRHWVFRIC